MSSFGPETKGDIVDDQRIISTYDMYLGDRRISAFFDEGTDGAASREHGTNQLLDQLAAVLEGQPVTAA